MLRRDIFPDRRIADKTGGSDCGGDSGPEAVQSPDPSGRPNPPDARPLRMPVAPVPLRLRPYDGDP